MSDIPTLRILGAVAALSLAGCLSASHEEPAPEALAKTTASEIEACPKYSNIVGSYAAEIQTCAQGTEDIDDCAPVVLKLLKPFFTCLDIPTPTVNTVQDLGEVSTELSDKLLNLDKNPAKLLSFAECVCGTSFRGGGSGGVLSGSFDGSTQGASGSFNGSTNGASGSFDGSTNGASGSFEGSTQGATGAFGN